MKTGAILLTLSVLVFSSSVGNAGERIYTLEDAYESAQRSNELVKISEENVFQAESRIDQAFTYLYPRLNGRSSYTRYNQTLPEEGGGFIFQPLSQLTAALVLTQPLYTGGRTMAALRTARTLDGISRRDLQSTKQDTMLSVASAYYAVLKAQTMAEKSRESVKRMERHKQVTEREASTRKSKANISNLLRARTLVSQARIILMRDENNLKVARQRLSLVTNLPETAVLAEPEPDKQPVENLESLTNTALANRDDFAASEMNQRAAEENITIVKGAHYPQLYAEAALQYTESHPATQLDDTIHYGGLRLQVPLFEGGLMKAETSEARSKLRQAQLSSQYLQRSIENDVSEAFIDYQTITSVLQAVKTQYQDAQSNFDAAESLFGQGLASSLALIDAQQALFVAERELVNATYDQQLAMLRLKRSTGVLGKMNGSIGER